MYRPRCIVMSVVLDELDEHGNIIGEQTTQQQRVFPVKWPTIAEDIEAAVAKLNAQKANN